MRKQQEFIKLIKENEGVIYKVTLIYAFNEEDKKDLYQEIVYQLWKSFDSFKGNAKISTWMYRVALNTAITNLKKEKRKGNKVSLDNVLLKRIDEMDTLMEDRLKILYEHIQRLNSVEKGIVLLYLEDKSHKEIAVITGFSKTNVGTRLARIKQKLKSQLKK